MTAISDDSIREKLRDQNPKTLADAVRESKRLAANQDLEKTRVKGAVRQISADQTEIEELKAQIKKLGQMKPRRQRSRNQQSRAMEGQWKSRVPKSSNCWRCHKKGPLLRWCPFTDEQIAEMKKDEEDLCTDDRDLGKLGPVETLY